MALADLVGTHWTGNGELWFDPLGDTAVRSACTLSVTADGVETTWSHEGTPHRGRLHLHAGGATFTDTFHAPAGLAMTGAASARALVDVAGTYEAGEGPPWGWRITLALRPAADGEPEALVLQMTNIAPWGEETRAVRMIATRR